MTLAVGRDVKQKINLNLYDIAVPPQSVLRESSVVVNFQPVNHLSLSPLVVGSNPPYDNMWDNAVRACPHVTLDIKKGTYKPQP